MFARKLITLSVGLLVVGAVTGSVRTDLSPCLPTSSGGAEILDHYQWVDTTTDKGHITWRQSIGLSAIPVSQIVLVSDTTVCRRAVTAYNSILAGDLLPPSSAVNVLKYGSTRYVISDPSHRVGEWISEPVVDTAFAEIATAGR